MRKDGGNSPRSQTRKRRKDDAVWKDQFKSNLTRMTFNLMLTRPMLEYLCATADSVCWDRSAYGSTLAFPDNFLGTEAALTRRGLIRRKPLHVVRKDKTYRTPCELTPAGEAVVELLKVGGLFLEASESIKRMRERPGRW